MNILENKVSLVTGASRGIGKAIAIKLAESGSDIAFTYRSSEEKALKLAGKLTSYGVKAKAYKSDASSFEATGNLIEEILTEFGKLDVVVNNAGITQDNLIMRMSEEQWDNVIDTNLKSVFNVTKNVIRSMMKARSGSIINITSIVGIRGNAGQSNYAASKAGIIGFTKSIALELGQRNIRSNAIAPGFIETEMTETLDEKTRETYFQRIPMRRFGSTEEVADTVLFLASDMSSYINGQVISVCGALNT